MRAAVYTRISVDRAGESLGVQRQLDDCRALADTLGWTVTETFTDNDRSATSGKPRPGFEALLATMAAGEVDAVLAWHPDRLYRRLSDLSRLLDVAKGVEFRTVTAGEMDLSTPTGRMVASIMGAVATAEVEHAGDRKRRAARQLAESGAPKWKRAFGYLATPTGPVPDPAVAPLVKEAYAAVLAGASLNDVCRLWNDAGALTITGKRWTAPQVSNFLRKPRNAGLRTYQADPHECRRDDVVGRGTWEPLVDEDLFWSVQALIGDRKRRPGPKSVRRHLLTGVLHCGKPGCGGTLSALQQQNRELAYICKKCRGVSIRQSHIEPMVYELIIGTLAAPDAVDLLKAESHDTEEAERLRIEAANLYAQLDQLGIDYAEGLLTARQVKTATDVIEAKLTENTRRQQDSDKLRVFDGVPLGTPEVAAAVEKLSPDRLRAIMDVLMEVTVMPVGKGGKAFKPERVQVSWR
ncbi:recombinase family protein [Mycolicibacter arupensis]|uniref:Recombinase family protein n=1 Tax=Mycolicibacter arupensis TaxID=342002 RepID=A0A5C7Y3M3_9MYCO|nr:recombinase family protein [Mycolicibacter arupensis]TXI56489.1 MAG: recombinase family protein [Mycolicibacter arupensis]